MSPLAHVIQVAICGAVVVGALLYLAGLAIVDHRQVTARVFAAVSRICEVCDGTGDSNGADWCEECAGTGREIDDPGADWDDGHDRWTDGQLGVA